MYRGKLYIESVYVNYEPKYSLGYAWVFFIRAVIKMKSLTVNGNEYLVVKLLGKGKGGYSYLAEKDGRKYVLKQIHHELCEYYSFGNKIEA